MRTALRTTGTDLLLAGTLAALLLATPDLPLAADDRGGPSPASRGTVLISIDGNGVTEEEFLSFADALYPERAERRRVPPGEAGETLVRNRLFAEMALREGLDRLPAVRSRLLARLSPLWNDAYWNDVVKPPLGDGESELAEKAPPGEETVTVGQITASTMEGAEEAARLLATGADFSSVARERSTGLTASRGGLVGEVTRRTDRYEPDIVERLFRMAPGEVTPVLETRTGYALLRVEAKTGADEARRRWVEANRASFLRRRDREAWGKARQELLLRIGWTLSTDTLERYRKDLRDGRSVAPLLDLAAARVGGEELRLRDVVDPAGTGSVHPEGGAESMVRSKAEDVAVALEAARTGLPSRHAGRALEERFLREKLLAREYVSFRTRGLTVTEKEMKERFRQDRKRHRLPRALDLSFVETRSPDRVRKALEELGKGSPFPEVARRWSDGGAEEGGRAGFVDEDSLDPALAALKSLRAGSHTKSPLTIPAADGSGDYLVLARVNAVRPGRLPSYNEADRQRLRNAVLARKRAETVRKILAEATRDRRVEILPALREAASAAGFAASEDQHGSTP